MANAPPNVLFYSKHCVHCRKFSELLYKRPDIDAQFIKISVDVRSVRLPSFVTEVPTIVVFDDYGQKHVKRGAGAFGWINQFLEEASKISITSYDEGVMGSSLSDNFSFIDETEETEHTFAYLDKMYATQIKTLDIDPTMTGGGTVNASDMERYTAERNKAVPKIQRQSNVDFSKGFNQENKAHRITEQDLAKFNKHRSQHSRRGPVPRRAPNFQTTNFSPGLSAQSRRGGYVPYGGASAGGANSKFKISDKERMLQSRIDRMQQEREKQDSMFGPRVPNAVPDFSMGGGGGRRGRRMPQKAQFRTL